MKFAIAKKIGMTRIFDETGIAVTATLLRVQPTKVKRVISESKNGYNAVVVTDEASKKPFECEFRMDSIEGMDEGKEISTDQFESGDNLVVKSKSKGKGFAGVIKRHNFSRGPMAHGSNHHRAPGSIGGGYPQRVVLGRRMAGRMGGDNVTLKNLKVLSVDTKSNILLVSGSVPGPKEAIVKVYCESTIKESAE